MNITKRTILAALLSFGLFGFGCDVDQTEEGRAPDIDIQADPGEAPEYDVDTAEVELKTEEETVRVPDIDVHEPEAEGYEE